MIEINFAIVVAILQRNLKETVALKNEIISQLFVWKIIIIDRKFGVVCESLSRLCVIRYRFLFCSSFLVCQHVCASLHTVQRGKSLCYLTVKSCIALVIKTLRHETSLFLHLCVICHFLHMSSQLSIMYFYM